MISTVSNARGAFKGVLIAAGLDLSLTCASAGSYWLLLSFAASVWTQHAIAEEIHDGVHHRLFTPLAVNEVAADIYGSLLGLPFAQYRADHLRHHRYFGEARDPDYPKYAARPASWLRYFVANFSGYAAVRRLFSVPVEIPRRDVQYPAGTIVAQLALIALGTVAVNPLWYPLLWLAPLFTATYGLTQFRTMLEHWSPDGGRLYNLTGFVTPHMLAAPFGYNYHGTHHGNAVVPNYRLNELAPGPDVTTMTFVARIREVVNHDRI